MSKKINFLRAGALTMVLALGTTCFMSGTLAKYVTSGQGSDSARVAKFGVTITANGETFAQTYATHDEDVVGTIANSVVSSNENNVVAPGTTKDMVSMTLAGTPEVAVRVSYDVTEFELTNWTTDGTDQYCPIIINVNGTEYNCLDAADIDSFEKTVIGAIEKYSKDYAANTNLAGVGNDSLAISWEWPFSTSADNDVKDTALGDRAAGGTDEEGNPIAPNPATIKLTVKTTVTQID